MGHTSKLVGMENAVLDSIKLELSSNHLLYEFTKCVKENNRFEVHVLARKRMSIAQMLLAKISLRYHQVIWLELGVEILEQVLSAFYISNEKIVSKSKWFS